MRPDGSFIGQPIRSLQTMLRVLGEYDEKYLPLIPDGIYGPSTMAAVSNFQRLHGLPVTGVTDQQTWEEIAARHRYALVSIGEAEPLQIVLNPNQVIRRGEADPIIYIVQGMLQALSDVYKSIGIPTHTGILDVPTSDSLSSFQLLSDLPMTGELDRHTWRHLALHHPQAVNIGKGPSQAGYTRENIAKL